MKGAVYSMVEFNGKLLASINSTVSAAGGFLSGARGVLGVSIPGSVRPLGPGNVTDGFEC